MPIDASYLSKLKDYYAKHNVIPSYATIGKLWGMSAKSWVANYVSRFKEEGYLKVAPDRRLGPDPRFFERRLARSPIRAGLPHSDPETDYEVVTIDSYLVKQPSKTSLIRVKGDLMIDAGILEGDLVVRHQRLEHVQPARALAIDRQTRRPEAIQIELLPQLHRQPARAPLPWLMQRQLREPHL